MMIRILYNILWLVLPVWLYLLMFKTSSSEIIIYFNNYKINISTGFFIVTSLIFFRLLSYLYQIILHLFFFRETIRKIWHKYKSKELFNKLFKMIYHISIDDKKYIEQNFNDLKFFEGGEVPENLVNIIKLQAAKYLNHKTGIDQLSAYFLKQKKAQALGVKTILEDKLNFQDPELSKIILKTLNKKELKADWAQKIDTELEKISGNAELAVDKLVKLEKHHIDFNSQTKEEIKNLILQKAKNLVEENELDQAKKILKKGLKLEGCNKEIFLLLIEVQMRQGNKWRANRLIKKAWESFPSDILLKKFAENNPKLNKNDLLKEQICSFKIENSLTSMMVLSKYLISIESFDQAKKYLGKISREQKPSEYYKLLAEIELKTGKNPEIISNLLEKADNK